jgi:glycosyltransferase involved in cell wall biosynthesis
MNPSPPEITVIVPAYNVAPFIEHTLNTVLNQMCVSLELVVVDDCSSDSTSELIQKVALNDRRVKVIEHNVNKGLHAARISGAKEALGAYIGFVDGDDWVDPEMYGKMLSVARESNADIVICGAGSVTPSGEDMGDKVRFRSRVRYDNIAALRKFCHLGLGTGVLWNKIYRSEIIRSNLIIDLPRDVDSGADYIVNFGAFADSRSVVAIPEVLYSYVQRMDSMSNSARGARSFSRTLLAYVHCIEANATREEEFLRLIDTLYCKQLTMHCYRVGSLSEFDSSCEGLISRSLERLAAVRPGGIYSLIHAFDGCNDQGRRKVWSALRHARSSLAILLRAIWTNK